MSYFLKPLRFFNFVLLPEAIKAGTLSLTSPLPHFFPCPQINVMEQVPLVLEIKGVSRWGWGSLPACQGTETKLGCSARAWIGLPRSCRVACGAGISAQSPVAPSQLTPHNPMTLTDHNGRSVLGIAQCSDCISLAPKEAPQRQCTTSTLFIAICTSYLWDLNWKPNFRSITAKS